MIDSDTVASDPHPATERAKAVRDLADWAIPCMKRPAETTPQSASGALGFGLIEAILALAGAVASAITGELGYAAAGFGLAAATLASRLARLASAPPRRLALTLWTSVAATIVLLLAGLQVPAALVAISSLLAATLVVSRGSR